jgi:hypothetical protein
MGSRMRECILKPLQPLHTHILGNCSTSDPALADGERSELFVVLDGRHPQQMPGGLGACFVFLANLHNEIYDQTGVGKAHSYICGRRSQHRHSPSGPSGVEQPSVACAGSLSSPTLPPGLEAQSSTHWL